MNLQDEVRSVVEREGVIARRDHPELANAMARLRRGRELVSVQPGVYAPPAAAGERNVRLAALARWAPEAVLTGRSAGQLTYWPMLPGSTIECAMHWDREPQPGFCFSRRKVPPELVVHGAGLLITDPSLTALDLSDSEGGEAIDRALRTRTATLDGLWEALAPDGGRTPWSWTAGWCSASPGGCSRTTPRCSWRGCDEQSAQDEALDDRERPRKAPIPRSSAP